MAKIKKGDLVEHVPGGSFSAESFGSDTTLAGWPLFESLELLGRQRTLARIDAAVHVVPA